MADLRPFRTVPFPGVPERGIRVLVETSEKHCPISGAIVCHYVSRACGWPRHRQLSPCRAVPLSRVRPHVPHACASSAEDHDLLPLAVVGHPEGRARPRPLSASCVQFLPSQPQVSALPCDPPKSTV